MAEIVNELPIPPEETYFHVLALFTSKETRHAMELTYAPGFSYETRSVGNPQLVARWVKEGLAQYGAAPDDPVDDRKSVAPLT